MYMFDFLMNFCEIHHLWFLESVFLLIQPRFVFITCSSMIFFGWLSQKFCWCSPRYFVTPWGQLSGFDEVDLEKACLATKWCPIVCYVVLRQNLPGFMDISILKWAKIDQLSMRGGGICFEFDAWRMYQRIGIRREYKNECPLVNKKRYGKLQSYR